MMSADRILPVLSILVIVATSVALLVARTNGVTKWNAVAAGMVVAIVGLGIVAWIQYRAKRKSVIDLGRQLENLRTGL